MRGNHHYRCQACGAVLTRSALDIDARDDWHCPYCGSLRLERALTLTQRIGAFLVEREKA